MNLLQVFSNYFNPSDPHLNEEANRILVEATQDISFFPILLDTISNLCFSVPESFLKLALNLLKKQMSHFNFFDYEKYVSDLILILQKLMFAQLQCQTKYFVCEPIKIIYMNLQMHGGWDGFVSFILKMFQAKENVAPAFYILTDVYPIMSPSEQEQLTDVLVKLFFNYINDDEEEIQIKSMEFFASLVIDEPDFVNENLNQLLIKTLSQTILQQKNNALRELVKLITLLFDPRYELFMENIPSYLSFSLNVIKNSSIPIKTRIEILQIVDKVINIPCYLSNLFEVLDVFINFAFEACIDDRDPFTSFYQYCSLYIEELIYQINPNDALCYFIDKISEIQNSQKSNVSIQFLIYLGYIAITSIPSYYFEQENIKIVILTLLSNGLNYSNEFDPFIYSQTNDFLNEIIISVPSIIIPQFNKLIEICMNDSLRYQTIDLLLLYVKKLPSNFENLIMNFSFTFYKTGNFDLLKCLSSLLKNIEFINEDLYNKIIYPEFESKLFSNLSTEFLELLQSLIHVCPNTIKSKLPSIIQVLLINNDANIITSVIDTFIFLMKYFTNEINPYLSQIIDYIGQVDKEFECPDDDAQKEIFFQMKSHTYLLIGWIYLLYDQMETKAIELIDHQIETKSNDIALYFSIIKSKLNNFEQYLQNDNLDLQCKSIIIEQWGVGNSLDKILQTFSDDLEHFEIETLMSIVKVLRESFSIYSSKYINILIKLYESNKELSKIYSAKIITLLTYIGVFCNHDILENILNILEEWKTNESPEILIYVLRSMNIILSSEFYNNVNQDELMSYLYIASNVISNNQDYPNYLVDECICLQNSVRKDKSIDQNLVKNILKFNFSDEECLIFLSSNIFDLYNICDEEIKSQIYKIAINCALSKQLIWERIPKKQNIINIITSESEEKIFITVNYNEFKISKIIRTLEKIHS